MIVRSRAMISIGIWLVSTVSLAVWWLIHGLDQVRRIGEMSHELSEEVLRGQRMLYGEGAFFLVLLILGGVALFYYNLREETRHRQTEEFFATLTHELKTPLASLRLQVECLQEDLGNQGPAKLLSRLYQDSVRLELQLENALFLAGIGRSEQLHIEDLQINQIVSNLQRQWPDLKINVKGDGTLRADVRALEGVLKNLVQNAHVHGRATEVQIGIESKGPKIQLIVQDNGQGFSGETKRLAQPFLRHTTTSGSGIGLYLSRKLVEKMNGRLEFFPNKSKGFLAKLSFDKGANG